MRWHRNASARRFIGAIPPVAGADNRNADAPSGTPGSSQAAMDPDTFLHWEGSVTRSDESEIGEGESSHERKAGTFWGMVEGSAYAGSSSDASRSEPAVGVELPFLEGPGSERGAIDAGHLDQDSSHHLVNCRPRSASPLSSVE